MEKTIKLEPIVAPNLNDMVYEVLREHILQHDFAPGQRLDLSELENALQVSRTPLKTALTRLEVEGLVEIHARRGTFVTTLSNQKLDEAYKIRSAFELYVALCLFQYLTPRDFVYFAGVRRELNDLAQIGRGDWHAIMEPYLRLDQQFHERFLMRGGTPGMVQLFGQLNVHMHMRRVMLRYHPLDFEAMHFEHEQLFAALEAQSPERLNAALLNHLEASRKRALKYSLPAPE